MKIFSIPAWWSDKRHPKRFLIQEFHKRISFSQENENESEDRMRHTTAFLSTETLEVPLKPGGQEASQLLLGVVHRMHHSSNQGEPKWLLLHLFEKLKTV